jgi:hypothetical protein
MLRPFSARQLCLVAGEGRVALFAVFGDRRRGNTVDVHVPTLIRRMRDLPADIETVVFFDEPVPDGALVAVIDDMVDLFTESDLDALAVGVPATEAVKWVEGGFITHAVDRSTLMSIRCPEVVRRSTLDSRLAAVAGQTWANPTELLVAGGASMRIYDPAARATVG